MARANANRLHWITEVLRKLLRELLSFFDLRVTVLSHDDTNRSSIGRNQRHISRNRVSQVESIPPASSMLGKAEIGVSGQ